MEFLISGLSIWKSVGAVLVYDSISSPCPQNRMLPNIVAAS